MATRIAGWCGAVLALLVCLTTTVLAIGAMSGGAAGCTLSSGRSVWVQSDGWTGLRLSWNRDTATIRTSGYTIVVAPQAVLLNGLVLANIEPAAKAVELTIDDGNIAVVADGRAIQGMRR